LVVRPPNECRKAPAPLAVPADDPERLGRFHREAQLLASLNHPNIAQIYGFERAGDSGLHRDGVG
jgi:serine/threonine protein kinase